MEKEILKAVSSLKEGGIIAYPSDTIWGIGCDARDSEAVNRLFSIKERPKDKAIIVLIHDISQLHDYVQQVPELAWDLVDYAEKPLTVIYPEGKNLAPELLADDGSVAIRLVQPGSFCYEMVRKFGRPVTSTSANKSGQPSPGSFAQIDQNILNQVDNVVNYNRNLKTGAPSTLVKLEMDAGIKFLRK